MGSKNKGPSIPHIFKQVNDAHGSASLRPGGVVKTKPWRLEVAEKAIQRLPDINTPHGEEGNTILHAVVERASREHQYAKGGGWNAKGEVQKQRSFCLKLVRFILKQNPSIDSRNAFGATALHYAASGHPKVLEELIKHGADPSVVDNNGFTPLINTCISKHVDAKVVEALLAAGADVGVRVNGKTALDFVKKKYPEIAKILKAKGAVASKAPQPSKKPAQDAKKGNLEALWAMADGGDGDSDAYKWLCAASDFGHKKAAGMAEDLLETSSLHADDDNLDQGYAHWELGVGYLKGSDGLPCNLRRAKEHLQFARKLMADNFEDMCKPTKILKGLDAKAKDVFHKAVGPL